MMTPNEIEEYQANIKPWIEDADVTMTDVVVHGIVDDCVNIANKAIEKAINPE